ncbi:MAG: DUF1080 domain-containing protein [Bryobacteraceae bacterium]|jgi:hypothetical protein
MKPFSILLMLCLAALFPALSQNNASPFAGRWDVTITTPTATYPGWLEVVDKDGALQARVQPRAGGVHPVAGVKMEGAKLILTLEAGSEGHPGARWELSAAGDRLSGELKRGDRTAGQVAGVRAPAMRRPAPAAWSAPEPIFNGKDLTGWEPDNAARNHWKAKDGVLVNEDSGANLKSTRKFDDFQLHIEFNCPQGGNSGVYLRGRYEIQVEYESVLEDTLHEMGSIYGYIAPAVRMPHTPGTWESFDATLVGRMLTLYRNGVKIIDNQEIPGITGGALDSHEGEPGPFYLQGDHYGVMQYRNITIRVPKQ